MSMRLYPRQQVEESLITHYKVGKSLPARSLQREVFAGVPGVYIGVLALERSESEHSYASIVFFAEASHPDEPIPHFRNLDATQSRVLLDNLEFLPHREAKCCLSAQDFADIVNKLNRPDSLFLKATPKLGFSHVYVIPTAGFVGVDTVKIVGTLSNPKVAREVYDEWERVKMWKNMKL